MASTISSCVALSSNFNRLSLNTFSSSLCHSNSLSFSSNVSHSLLYKGGLSMSVPIRRSVVVCEAAPPMKKPDSAVKRVRQAEKRRLYNKSRKSEVKTRMKKVLDALDVLRKKPDAQPTEVVTVEKLIGEAYSVIDKAVKVGTLHRNTGARRKSRLARRKKAVEIHHGWYTPTDSPTSEPASVSA